MKIRKFHHNDRQALIDLWSIVFPDNSPHNAPALMIDDKCKVDDLIFVAEFESKLVGACMAGYDGYRGWLYAVAVLAEHRRNGVGAQLIDGAIGSLKELGCKKVNLQIRSTNTEVAAFYQSLGFVTEERLSMGAFIN